VGDQIALAVGGLVDGVAGHHHAAEMHAAEVADPVVVIAGHVDDVHPLAGQAQDLLHHVVMGLRPVETALHLPAVDDVAHQIQRVAFQLADEVEQKLRLTAAGAEVDVGKEHRAIAAMRGAVHPTSPRLIA
jgi:hypothetical protein